MNETINELLLYEGKIFDVSRVTVRLPDGRAADRDLVIHSGASAVIPVLDDGRILFVRQYRESVGAEILEIPAGRLDQGEDPVECARRELEEETGCRAAGIRKLTQFFPVVGYSTEVIHLFVAEGLSAGAAQTDEDEFVTAEAVSLGDALRMVDEGKIADGKTILAILLYEREISRRNLR
jgi:ADP-ribose pyrophosphatase